MKSVPSVDNKGIAVKIMANTPAFSILKNAVATKIQIAANKKRVAYMPPKLAF